MTDIISQSESDRIVAQDREARASRIAHGLKPDGEVPKMSLGPQIPKETFKQYEERLKKHGIMSSFKDSDK